MTRDRRPDAALDRLLDGLIEDILAAPDDDLRPALAGPDGRRALRAARDAIAEGLAHGEVASLGRPPGDPSSGRRDPRVRPH